MTGEPGHALTVPALRVHQWLPEWNEIEWNARAHQSKPNPCFYMFTLSAFVLRKLSAIYRRSAKREARRTADLGIVSVQVLWAA